MEEKAWEMRNSLYIAQTGLFLGWSMIELFFYDILNYRKVMYITFWQQILICKVLLAVGKIVISLVGSN